jgi:membrane protein
VQDRFLSFTMVLGTGFLLLVSMLLTAALQGAGKFAATIVSLPPAVWAAINSIVSLLVIACLFAAIFKVLPDVEIRWRDVRVGAIATAALFVAGKFALGWYLGRESTASAYGTAGSLVLVLLWVYYSSVILLLGAEFTQVWAMSHGAQIVPDNDAVVADLSTDRTTGS